MKFNSWLCTVGVHKWHDKEHRIAAVTQAHSLGRLAYIPKDLLLLQNNNKTQEAELAAMPDFVKQKFAELKKSLMSKEDPAAKHAAQERERIEKLKAEAAKKTGGSLKSDLSDF